MKRLGRAVALVLTVFCLAASGCTSIFNEEVEGVLTPTPAPVELVPQAGGDLFIAIPDDVTSFDPLTVTSEDLINFLSLIYETPFVYNESGQLQNCLVDSWDVNGDSTVFTFRLREDVYFSDGDPLRAEDVVASARRVLERSASPVETVSEEAAADETLEEDPVNGTGLANRYAAYNSEILSVEPTAETEVRITLRQAGSAALHFMTFPVTKANFRGGDVPMGTGPYKVDSFTQGSQAVLSINELWWRERPYIDRIVANAVSGPTQKMEMLETSILDFVTTDAVNSGNYNVVGQWQVIDYMTDYYDCLVPNLQHPELRRLNVRRAISAALDRREILSTVLLNHGVPSLLPIAPDFYAVDARYRSGQSSPGEARELLEAAGYRVVGADEETEETVLQLRLIVPDTISSTYKREAARAIVKQLSAVGIEIEIAELGEEEYLTALEGGDFDLAYCSYYLSEVPNLAFMFDVGGSGNYGHVDDPELSKAIEACRQAISEEDMREACAVLQERLSSLLPQIGLYFRMNSIICDEGIHGIHDVRQNEVFATVSEWYNSYFAQPVPQNATPSPTELTHQTEPESVQTDGSPSPQASRTAAASAPASWGPAPDPASPDAAETPPAASREPAPESASAPDAEPTAITSWGPAPDPTPPD